MIGAGNKTSLGGEVGSEAVGNSLGTIVGLPLAVIPPAESISPVTTSATMSTTARGSDAHRGDSLRFHGGSEGGEGAGGARRLRRPLLISPVIFCELASVCGRILSSACQQLCPRKRAQAPMPRLRPDEDARQERSRMNLKVPSKGERTTAIEISETGTAQPCNGFGTFPTQSCSPASGITESRPKWARDTAAL